MTTTVAGHGESDSVPRELLILGLALAVFDAAVVVSALLQGGESDRWVAAALWGAAGAAAVLPLMVLAHVAPRLRRIAVIAGVAALLALLMARVLLGKPGGEAPTPAQSTPAHPSVGDAGELDAATERLNASRERLESLKLDMESRAEAPGEAGRYGRINLRAYKPVIRAAEKYDREATALQDYLASLSGPKRREQVTRLLEHTDRTLAAIDEVLRAVERFPEQARAAAKAEGVPPERVEAWLRERPQSSAERAFRSIRTGMLEIREKYRRMLEEGRWENDVLVDVQDAAESADPSRSRNGAAGSPPADRDLRRP